MSSVEATESIISGKIAALRSNKRPAYKDLAGIPLSPAFIATQIPIVVHPQIDDSKWHKSTLALDRPSAFHQRASSLALPSPETHDHEMLRIEFADEHR